MQFMPDWRKFVITAGCALLGGASGVLGSAALARADTTAQFTDPTKPRLHVRVANVSDNTITLAWDPPASNESWWFYVYDNGNKEFIVGTSLAGAPTGATLKRLKSGQTHAFTVTYGDFIGIGDSARISAPSAPVRVTLPPNVDTTPPTTPGNLVSDPQPDGCRFLPDGCSFLAKWAPSTDDVTPQDELQYDFITWVGFTLVYDVQPDTFDLGSGTVRAVDAAGNRSRPSNQI
jgi:hypothetical protein